MPQESSLSRREEQILALISQGANNRQIAQDLRTSEAMLRDDLTHLCTKLQISTRVELLLYAYSSEQANKAADAAA